MQKDTHARNLNSTHPETPFAPRWQKWRCLRRDPAPLRIAADRRTADQSQRDIRPYFSVWKG